MSTSKEKQGYACRHRGNPIHASAPSATAVKLGVDAPIDSPASVWSSSSAWARLVQIPCLLWAFTESNFITFVVPNTAFGVLSASTGPKLLLGNAGTDGLMPATILWRTLLALVFNWVNVLIFDLQNQTSPHSLEEDLANKPWRPIPSGRITTQQARRALVLALPLCLAINRMLGVQTEGLYIQIGSYTYNDLRGGDSKARDVLIAIAFSLFNTASLRIVAGSASTEGFQGNDTGLQEGILQGFPAPYLESGPQLRAEGYAWVGLISVVILTTMQVQDLKDQVGDRLRGRWTVPLAFGNWASRVSLALLIPFWTVFCACIWWPRGHWTIILPPFIIGALVTIRVLVKRTPKADSNTWKLWCFWGVGLYYLAPASLI